MNIMVPAVPFAIGLTLLSFSWSRYTRARDRVERGVVAIGTVTGYEERTEYSSTDDEDYTASYPQVEYTDAMGTKRSFTSSVGGAEWWDIGEELEVLFDPGGGGAEIKSIGSLYGGSIGLGVLAIAGLGVGVMLFVLILREP